MIEPTQDDRSAPPIDMLEGAEEIAIFFFWQYIKDLAGEERKQAIKKYRRKVYHLSETSRFPTFRLGSTLHARKSSLKKYIEDQERMSSRNTVGWEDRTEPTNGGAPR